MEDVYIQLISEIKLLIDKKCSGCCVSIFDKNGVEDFYLKVGEPTPCSISFSRKKAFTAYSFNEDNDDIYQSMAAIGSQSLVNEDYCFISGGIVSENNKKEKLYIGVSSDVPCVDKEIAIYISKILK